MRHHDPRCILRPIYAQVIQFLSSVLKRVVHAISNVAVSKVDVSLICRCIYGLANVRLQSPVTNTHIDGSGFLALIQSKLPRIR